MQALIDGTALSVPKSLVAIEIERLRQGALRDLQARGIAGHDVTLPTQLFQVQADRRVRLGLILSELVARNGLHAKPEQIRAIVEARAQSFEQPEVMVLWYYERPERLAEVEGTALEDNVVDWVIGKSKTESVATTFQELMTDWKTV